MLISSVALEDTLISGAYLFLNNEHDRVDMILSLKDPSSSRAHCVTSQILTVIWK